MRFPTLLFGTLIVSNILGSNIFGYVAYGNETCSDIRLDAPGGSMEHVAVRSQMEFGICFSETAVQATDAYRFSHPNIEGSKDYSFQGSAFIAAIETTKSMEDLNAYHTKLLQEGKLEFKPGSFGATPVGGFVPNYKQFGDFSSGDLRKGGFVCQMFEHLQNSGMRKAIDAETKGNYWVGLVGILRLEWAKIHAFRHPEAPSFLYFPPPTSQNPLAESVAFVSKCLQSSGIQAGQVEILRALMADTETSILALVTAEDSKEKRLKLPPSVHCTSLLKNGTASEYIAQFHAHFDQNNAPIQPLGVSLCSKFLEPDGGANYKGVISDATDDNSETVRKDCGRHALLIIGRRTNPKTGRCQFLLRNSWGTSPNGYAIEWEADHGNVWVDQDALAANTYDLDVLK